MKTSLTIKVDESSDKTIVYFAGHINEDADFSTALIGKPNGLILDFANILFINSCGIREWIQFQDKLPNHTQLIYRNCPQVIVEQMNIIKGFVRKGGIIESFYAPYFDEENNEELQILITPDDVKDGKAPRRLNKEGHELEFDEIEAQYFNFLKNL
jgi:anti-anti-sigma regulatory factor